jgi:hypothetical protein
LMIDRKDSHIFVRERVNRVRSRKDNLLLCPTPSFGPRAASWAALFYTKP